MSKKGLITLSGILWTIAGFNILRKGIPALIADHRLLIVLGAIIIGTGFTMMFHKVSRKYADRVINLEGERFPFYRFMSLKGYLLIGIMMTLGISFSLIPGVPQAFFAFFYVGLGTGLSYGAIRFFLAALKA